jgi:hypothetical protein
MLDGFFFLRNIIPQMRETHASTEIDVYTAKSFSHRIFFPLWNFFSIFNSLYNHCFVMIDRAKRKTSSA